MVRKRRKASKQPRKKERKTIGPDGRWESKVQTDDRSIGCAIYRGGGVGAQSIEWNRIRKKKWKWNVLGVWSGRRGEKGERGVEWAWWG